MQELIGRKNEVEQLERCYADQRSHFVAVYGRRRVGKTYLIKTLFEDRLDFFTTGLAQSNMLTQLAAFRLSLLNHSNGSFPIPNFTNWLDAFSTLIKLLERNKNKKKVVFFDELPWMDTRNSSFISGLEYFWNSWASSRKDILLIVCGSAASWMINKLIKNKKGLHNRVTKRIKLDPFQLFEVEKYLLSLGCRYDTYQILQIYMALGGIPFYLDQIDLTLSATKNIDKLFFGTDAKMREEYELIFHSLFSGAHRHMKIIEALSTKKGGLLRNEIITKTKLPDAGSTTNLLHELEQSNFIRVYRKFGKKSRESSYQLIDQFTLFYHRFVRNANNSSSHIWINKLNTPEYFSWAGNAFEIAALLHIPQIKKALGIHGIYSEVSSWQNEKAQIDLVIDRKDQVINLIEMKFSINEFTITKKVAENLRNKEAEFIKDNKTRKAIWTILLTTYGLVQNKYSGIIQKTIPVSELFIQP